MKHRLGSRRKPVANKVGVQISGQQQNLKKQHAGRPDGRTAAEPRENESTYQRLYLKQQKRTDKNGQSISKHRGSLQMRTRGLNLSEAEHCHAKFNSVKTLAYQRWLTLRPHGPEL